MYECALGLVKLLNEWDATCPYRPNGPFFEFVFSGPFLNWCVCRLQKESEISFGLLGTKPHKLLYCLYKLVCAADADP